MGRRVVLDFSGVEDVPARAFVYIHGKKFQDQKIEPAKEVQELLKNVANFNLCPGHGLKPLSKSFATFNRCYYAANCAVVSESLCIACKYLRNLAQNTMSRKKKKKASSTYACFQDSCCVADEKKKGGKAAKRSGTNENRRTTVSDKSSK